MSRTNLSKLWPRKAAEVCMVNVIVKYLGHLYSSTDAKLLADHDGYSAVFIKNMGYYIPKERFSNYIGGKFANFKHTFLILDPHQAEPSRWKIFAKCGYPILSQVLIPWICIQYNSDLYDLFGFIHNAGIESKLVSVIDMLLIFRKILRKSWRSTLACCMTIKKTSRTCANCTTVPPLYRGEPSRTQHLGPLSSKHAFLT